MSTGYQIDRQDAAYFLTFQIVDWVDIFSRQVYRDILLESFTFCRKEKGLRVWAYVVMTNHIHCILSAERNNLSDVVRDYKQFTSHSILESIQNVRESREDWMLKRFEFAARKNGRNSSYQVWTHDNHAEELFSGKFFNQKINYIHMNPVRAGWVDKAEDWMYSSCRNYCLFPAMIEIDLADI